MSRAIGWYRWLEACGDLVGRKQGHRLVDGLMGSECNSAERENDAAFSEMKEHAIWKVTKQKLGMVGNDEKDPNSRSFR